MCQQWNVCKTCIKCKCKGVYKVCTHTDMWFLHMKYMTIVGHSPSLWWFPGPFACNVLIYTYVAKDVWVWSYCTDKSSNIKDSALPLTLTDNQLTADNNQAATAGQDTHYKRQQITSWLDSRLQELARRPQSEALEPVWSGSSFYWQES